MLVAALMASLLSGEQAQAVPQYNLVCSSCHGMPPLDSADGTRKPVEGSFKGSHQKHATTAASSCVVCHGDNASYSMSHKDKVIDMKADINGGTYSRVFFNQSSVPPNPLGFCSSVSCHDDGLGSGAASLVTTPDWGESVPRCSACHPSRPITGSHNEHLATVNTACDSCHSGAVESSAVPTQHSDGNIDVYKTAPGDLGYPADKAKGSAYTTCTTSSCHTNPSNNGQQMVSPVWGDTTQPKCTYCHASRPATGSHTAHYDAGFATCNNCHNGAVEGTTLSTSHSNNVIDVYKTTPGDYGYPSPKAVGSAPGKCSTGSCHEDGRGNFVASPTWGSTVPNCSACHATLPDTGSHVQHITGVGVTCGNCHRGAVQGTTAPTLHMNGVVDVYKTTPGDFGGGYPAAGKTKGSDFASCTTVNCHGRLSPVWGANTPNYQCTKCHGKGVLLANYSTATHQQAAPGYDGTGLGVGRQTGTVTSNVSSDPKVGAHDTHMRSLNNLGKPAACSDCHVVPATAFIAGHMDGSSLPTWSNLVQNKETIPGSARPYTYNSNSVLVSTYDSLTGTCSNTYCHGGTLPGGTDKSPKWNDSTYLTGNRAVDCAKCHGYPPETSTRLPHTPPESYTDCAGCHPHNGSRDSTDPLLGRDFHMNGNLEATGYCNTCHDYDTRGTDGLLWGKSQMAVEGFGAHAMHINYLKKRMNVTTMNANEDHYGTANFDGVCGVCHSRDINDHQQSNRTTSTRNINFGDVAHAAARQFGANPPQYNGLTGESSATRPKTCSNIDCHYKTSPIWQPY
jgi:predicted CxxxxCH...CXXCH cytochrome family protein